MLIGVICVKTLRKPLFAAIFIRAPFYRFFKAERIPIFAKKIDFCFGLAMKNLFVWPPKTKKIEIADILIKELEMFSNEE